jgi:hypothetical protein
LREPSHRTGRRRLPAATLAALAACTVAATVTSVVHAAAPRGRRVAGPPARLADTGLYSDFAARTVDSRNVPYSPQYPLWTDGALKARWIRLPPGTAIDARDPEVWRFPVGTKLWKEFSWSRRVETRYLERTREGWIYATYAWTDDERDAVLVPERGATSTYEVAPGKRHALPSVADCKSCHQGGRSEILGFGALQLSPDRDPLAPGKEPLEPGMATLPVLVERGLVRGLPRELLRQPPRIAASTPRGRAAMGYLHANCSICHDSVGPLASVGVSLRHPLDARGERDEPALAAIGQTTRFQIPGARGANAWIVPGAPASSAVVARVESTSPVARMPPLGTQVVDAQAAALLREWIEHDLGPAGARPAQSP